MKRNQAREDMRERPTPVGGRYTQSTIRRLIWASRLCVANRVEGEPGADWLAATFDGRAERKMLLALIRVWDGILVTSNRKLVLHEPDCACLSEHEYALLAALCDIEHSDAARYTAALRSVLPPSAARLLRTAIEELARSLDVLERQTQNFWLTGDTTPASAVCSRRLH